MKARALRSIYQLKITLRDVEPPIWRRLQMSSTDNLEDLHIAAQISMGWANAHIHAFSKDSHHYGVPDEDLFSHIHDEIDFRLGQVLKEENEILNYVYDFGDSWEHEIKLEKILPYDTGITLPQCVEG